MKKRVRILVSLLMISGSLTLTSQSYAEHVEIGRSETSLIASCLASISGIAGIRLIESAQKGVTKGLSGLLTANRFYKLGEQGLRVSKVLLEFSTWSSIIGCGISGTAVIVYNAAHAAEIVENLALAMQNDEEFRLLAESVGIDEAASLMNQIAKGDYETLMNSSMLEQNSNIESSFLDLGNEEDIESGHTKLIR